MHIRSWGIEVTYDTASNETITSSSVIATSCIQRRKSVAALTAVGEVSVNGLRAFDINLVRSYGGVYHQAILLCAEIIQTTREDLRGRLSRPRFQQLENEILLKIKKLRDSPGHEFSVMHDGERIG